MSFTGESKMDIYLLNLSGPFNESRVEPVVEIFRELVDQGVKRVVVNLKDVPLLDSRGLAALITGFKLFGGEPEKFRLVNLQDQPKLVFELTGFDYIFQIFDEVAEAAEIDSLTGLDFDRNLPVAGVLFEAAQITV